MAEWFTDENDLLEENDYRLTAREQREGEPLTQRLDREVPDEALEGEGVRQAPSPHVAGPAPGWNVVVTVREEGFNRAMAFLARFGTPHESGFYNVVTMQVADTGEFLDEVARAVAEDPSIMDALSRVVPVSATFEFSTIDEFERGAHDAVSDCLDDLAGASFHVRVHARRAGSQERVHPSDEEELIGRIVLDELEATGEPGSIDFHDPDVVIDVETVGMQAGLALLTRDDRRDFPFLGVD
jgi:tRNA(Ser,Leu) C12 N-acetylase TAN1